MMKQSEHMALALAGSTWVIPPEAPLTLLIWGVKRARWR
jgi:hypothetical protein